MASNFNVNDHSWPKLGVSSTSKSIVRTPAQDRMSRLRKVLADTQKQTQIKSKEIIQSAKSSGTASTSLMADGRWNLSGRPRRSVQERLIRARNAAPATKVNLLNEPSALRVVASTSRIPNSERTACPSDGATPLAERCRTTYKKGFSLLSSTVLCDLLSTSENVKKSSDPDGKSQHTLKDITQPTNTELKTRKRKSNNEESDTKGKTNKASPKSELGNIIDEFSDKSARSEKVINKKTPKKTLKSEHLHRARKSLQKRVETLPPVEKMDVEEDEFSTIIPPTTNDTETSSFPNNMMMTLIHKIKDGVSNVFSNEINLKSTYHRVTKEAQSDREALNPSSIYVIPDTNIFLQHLTFIKDLLERPIQNNTAIILYVPYVVIEELDKLKGQKDRSISTLAMRAVKYLNEKLENRNKSILGQTVVDSLREIIPVKFADDGILNCCLQLKEKKLRPLLLSNDINLRNKALINDVRALSSADVEVDNVERFL